MKQSTLLLGGIALLAGTAAYLLYSRRKQSVPAPVASPVHGHAKGEKLLRRALHKAKLAE